MRVKQVEGEWANASREYELSSITELRALLTSQGLSTLSHCQLVVGKGSLIKTMLRTIMGLQCLKENASWRR